MDDSENRQLSDALRRIIASTWRNEQSVKECRKCGCVHCVSIFPPEQVTEWENGPWEGGRSALCPNCGKRWVICDILGDMITEDLLKNLHSMLF